MRNVWLVAALLCSGIALASLGGCKGKSGDASAKGDDAAAKSGDATAKSASTAASAVQVRVADLLKDYKDNEVRADGKYKGKRLRLTGKVGDIKKDITDSIYVTLGTGAELEIPQAQCFFGDEHAAKASELSRGDEIAVECTCDGLMMNVIMKDCSFYSAFAEAPPSGGAALAICGKLAAAGVASTCKQRGTDDTAVFKGPPGKGGLIMVMADDSKLQKAAAVTAKSADISECFQVAKQKALVCVLKGAEADVIKKTKAVVDGL